MSGLFFQTMTCMDHSAGRLLRNLELRSSWVIITSWTANWLESFWSLLNMLSKDSFGVDVKFSNCCLRKVFCVFLVASFPPNLATIAWKRDFAFLFYQHPRVSSDASYIVEIHSLHLHLRSCRIRSNCLISSLISKFSASNYIIYVTNIWFVIPNVLVIVSTNYLTSICKTDDRKISLFRL